MHREDTRTATSCADDNTISRKRTLNDKAPNNITPLDTLKKKVAKRNKPNSIASRALAALESSSSDDDDEEGGHQQLEVIDGNNMQNHETSDGHLPVPADKSEQPIDDTMAQNMLNQNDVVLSMYNPTYKAILFDQFRILGPTRDLEKESNISNELFLMFKDGGGRFFKIHPTRVWSQYPNQISSKHYEVNEKVALASELKNYAIFTTIYACDKLTMSHIMSFHVRNQT